MALCVAAAVASGLASSAGAQTRITGRVVDPDNAPIGTAQVQVTGTTIGTNSSDSGTFTLQVPADGKTLTVRRIGFLGKTVPITAGQTSYTITLTRDVLRLEAQVVTGVATTVSSQELRQRRRSRQHPGGQRGARAYDRERHSGARARSAHLAEQRW